MKKWSDSKGSHYPAIGVYFDVADTLRALLKLSLNLIAALCPNTPVNNRSFASVTRTVLNLMNIPERLLATNGFVCAEDIQFIAAPNNAHSFRLVHVDNRWHVYSSFFGGRIGSYIRMAGPNREEWIWADVIAPLFEKEWSVETHTLLPPQQRVRVNWDNGSLIAPTFKLENSVSRIGVETVPRKPPPAYLLKDSKS